MSLISKIFGGGKDKSPSAAEAIQKLKETELMLTKKQEFLEAKIEQELSTAKKNGTKNKRVALQALKRKKRYEKQLQQIDGTLSTIELQREALEGATSNTAVFQAMNEAAKSLKGVHQSFDVDKVHDMMDEVAEQHEIAKEISDAISNPLAFGQDVDEEDLEKELEELEQEEMDRQLLEVKPSAEELPTVPSAEPSRAKPSKSRIQEKDEDLEELEAWAS
ncbi:charged multivesicular body protein 4b-like [Artemia franciscana]|uniref:Charged multivesicular body protein 4b n=1 Tax=Artemia franciscana TaxID=6661 RepID=A0AA88KVT7_ARTSF|nr:hypothetical protein QYM36_014596 [Artemia franciscana]